MQKFEFTFLCQGHSRTVYGPITHITIYRWQLQAHVSIRDVSPCPGPCP